MAAHDKHAVDPDLLPKLTSAQWRKILFRSSPEKIGYISTTEVYGLSELRKRLGVSSAWLAAARAKKLPFLKINGNDTEVISGADFLAFLKEHPNLLQEHG